MKLDEAIRSIEQCSERMNAKYGGIVFDEWIIVLMGKTDKILAHSGPRGEEIVLDFGTDTKAIHDLLHASSNFIGDFGFTHEGHGTRFDAYTVLSNNLFLLWNKTDRSTTHITRNPSWQVAQIEFAMLAKLFKANPVEYSE
ncbi:MAG: hypothetical protein JWM68_623 [Verrucomicrobiales bacterium]|nr:hypothetical protein [Verrucomicrobiales bacterium]